MWRRQVAGLAGWESEGDATEWERRARELLVDMCEWIGAEAEKGRLATEAVRDRVGDGGGQKYGLESVVQLWREMERVSTGIRGAVVGGQSVW